MNKDKYTLRLFTKADFTAVMGIENTCFESMAVPASAMRKILAEEGCRCILALDKATKTVVGYGMCKENYLLGIGYLYSVGVLSPYRKQGIGLELVKRRIAYLRTLGCTRIQLHTLTDNRAIHDIMLSLGFTVIQYVPAFYNIFIDGLLWEKQYEVR